MNRAPRTRRGFLQAAGRGVAMLGAAGLPACSDSQGADALLQRLGFSDREPDYEGDFVGQRYDRGHLIRAASTRKPDATQRTQVVIAGCGIAGLAAARALKAGGVSDYRLFDLEDEAGGNSRGGIVGGYACPWGAHYLPTPGPYADEVSDLLTEYKLRAVIAGKARYDEAQLCHSPQERLFVAGGWQDGLLPVRGQDAATFEAYRKFSRLVREAASSPRAFTIPTSRSIWDEQHAELDAQTFAQWLDAQGGLGAPALRWYLDYCCRDDYGAGIDHVSAWAGLHYFASRHGFSAPSDPDEADRDFEDDGVLTWPEGNAWLARKLAAPHRDQTSPSSLVLRINETKHEVEVDVLDTASDKLTRWIAARVIVATPLFVAARLLSNPPDALRVAAAKLPHAPWLVANLHIDTPLDEHVGNAPLSWDNVIYGSPGLGYVNAMNQSTRAFAGGTVLSYYAAFGNDPMTGRKALLEHGWRDWSETVLAELKPVHPDLRMKVRRIEIMRYGHAMAIPAPGVRGSDWLAALRQPQGRITFAHSDLSAYSVFEEAFHWGLEAGNNVGKALRTAA